MSQNKVSIYIIPMPSIHFWSWSLVRRLNLKHRKTLQVPELKENAINITCQMSPLLFLRLLAETQVLMLNLWDQNTLKSVLSIALFHHSSQLLKMFSAYLFVCKIWRNNINAFIQKNITDTKIRSDKCYHIVMAYSVTNGVSIIISYANDRRKSSVPV